MSQNKIYRSVVPLLFFASTVTFAAPVSGPADPRIRDAAARAVNILQQSNKTWFEKQACASCHHQALSLVAFKMAGERKVPVDPQIASMALGKTFAFAERAGFDGALQGSHRIDPALGEALFAFTAAELGTPHNFGLSLMARSIAGLQFEDGHWRSFDSRPPQMYGAFSATALSLHALQRYASPRMQADTDRRVELARKWLLVNQPRSTEDTTFRLLGLAWSNASTDSALQDMRKLQRADGGWAQEPGFLSDAYATGEALYAMKVAGVPASDPAYVRGLSYLISTQHEDGSWLVRTRMHGPAPVSPPYSESGFPYGKDQFISASATGWAAIALLNALEPAPASAPAPAPPQAAPVPEWIETALFGTVDELRAALDSGLDANQATPNGTTLLMLAAPDFAKTKLLLDRGAMANARAKSGYTPLLVAAGFRGSAPVLRLLLERGADVNPASGKPALFGASALFWSVFAGDLETTRLLLDRGARLDGRASLGGLLAPFTPVQLAAMNGDSAMVQLLAERGANVNEGDSFGVTPLSRAVLANSLSVARALVANGAKVNHVDQLGMTALLYAATRDFGDTKMMEFLLASGADRKTKTKEGKTVAEQARTLGHTQMAKLLQN